MSQVIGIYHKDCIDGTTAATVLLRRSPHSKLFPLAHSHTGEELAAVLNSATAGDKIYTLDCGLSAPEFLARGFEVTTIDHHLGAREHLESLEKRYSNYSYIFDNRRSGASLSWLHFFPNEDVPELIKYVEDADLWSWQFGDVTKDVNNYLYMFRNDPKAVLRILGAKLTKVKEDGKIISLYADKEIEELVQTPGLQIRVDPYNVPAFNITRYESACGNILSQKHDSSVAMFTILGDQVKLSFRGKETHEPSALELARLLGGSGHKNAAGAHVSLTRFLDLIND